MVTTSNPDYSHLTSVAVATQRSHKSDHCSDKPDTLRISPYLGRTTGGTELSVRCIAPSVGRDNASSPCCGSRRNVAFNSAKSGAFMHPRITLHLGVMSGIADLVCRSASLEVCPVPSPRYHRRIPLSLRLPACGELFRGAGPLFTSDQGGSRHPERATPGRYTSVSIRRALGGLSAEEQ